MHHSAQFGKSFQTAHQRVTRIYLLADIISQQMPVVRTHWNFVVNPVLTPPARLFHHQRSNHAYHVRTSREVLGFVEGAIALAGHLAKMHKVNTLSESADHGQQIVIGPGPVGPDAEG